MDSNTIGMALKQQRAKLGMSQEEFADLIGMSLDWVRSVESGRTKRPRVESLMRVADALRISPTVLLGEDEDIQQQYEESQYMSPERVQVLNASFHTLQRLSWPRLREVQRFLEVFAEMSDDEFQNPVRKKQEE